MLKTALGCTALLLDVLEGRVLPFRVWTALDDLVSE